MKKLMVMMVMAMFLSVSASVVADVLLGHWMMDDNLLDSSGNGYDGTYDTGIPVFSTDALDGSSLELFDDPNGVVIDPTPFESYDNGMSVTFWAKTSGTGTWMVPVAKRVDNAAGWAFQYHWSNCQVGLYINPLGTCYVGNDFGGLCDGQWHFIAGTYDASVGEMKIYVDGIEINSLVNTATVPTNSGVAVTMGKDLRDWTGNSPFEGMLDDVRIFDYPLDATEVLGLYVDIAGEICLDPPTMDVTGPEDEPDCKVDMLDFAVFASQWLESGIYTPPQ